MGQTDTRACCSPEELSAHLDGDLPQPRAVEVHDHLLACQACCQVRDELVGLAGELVGLSQLAPQRDLWPAVVRRHAAEREQAPGLWVRLRRFWALPVAAALGAAAVLVVVLLMGRPWDSGSPAPDVDGRQPVQALQAVLQAEQTYAEAVASLQQAVAAQKPAYSPEVEGTLERGLADIDRTLDDCRQALRRSPDNLQAHQTMLAAYQHKVDFLTELLGERM